jgi:hypothetical protein
MLLTPLPLSYGTTLIYTYFGHQHTPKIRAFFKYRSEFEAISKTASRFLKKQKNIENTLLYIFPLFFIKQAEHCAEIEFFENYIAKLYFFGRFLYTLIFFLTSG